MQLQLMPVFIFLGHCWATRWYYNAYLVVLKRTVCVTCRWFEFYTAMSQGGRRNASLYSGCFTEPPTNQREAGTRGELSVMNSYHLVPRRLVMGMAQASMTSTVSDLLLFLECLNFLRNARVHWRATLFLLILNEPFGISPSWCHLLKQ